MFKSKIVESSGGAESAEIEYRAEIVCVGRRQCEDTAPATLQDQKQRALSRTQEISGLMR